MKFLSQCGLYKLRNSGNKKMGCFRVFVFVYLPGKSVNFVSVPELVKQVVKYCISTSKQLASIQVLAVLINAGLRCPENESLPLLPTLSEHCHLLRVG